MRVFVTGATGFIGQIVVRELLQAGHNVLGLARNDAAADTLARVGIDVHRGDLNDAQDLAAAARTCDGVIHTAFIHDFANWHASIATDRHVVESFINALEGSGKPLVIASGTAMLPHGRLGTEHDTYAPDAMTSPRGATEAVVLSAAQRGVRGIAVRLSPTVHGAGDHGFVPRLVQIAKDKGVAAFVGEGANRWPAVHRFDAAKLFRLAFESGKAGTPVHAVGEEGVPMRDIMTAIGEGLGLPVKSIAPAEVEAHFGWIGPFAMIDNPTSSRMTQDNLNWRPEGIKLLDDIRANYLG